MYGMVNDFQGKMYAMVLGVYAIVVGTYALIIISHFWH